MKTTAELINEIKKSQDIYEYIENNELEFKELSLSDFFNEMLEKYDLTKSKVLKRAQMTSNNYGYEIINSDKKVASRDKIIKLCLGFPLNLEETQTALICAKARPLYPRDKRDAIIMMAVKSEYTIDQLNDVLFENTQVILE